MSDDPGRRLLTLLRRRAAELLERARQAVQDAGVLAGLGPAGPAWDGTVLAGRLLAPVGTFDPDEPLAAAVLGILRRPVSVPGGEAGLYGWDPGAGRPRGLAWALRTGAGGQGVCAALAVTAGGLEVLVSGVADGPVAAAGTGGWTLGITGRAAGGLHVRLPVEGPAEIAAGTPGDRLEITATGPGPAYAVVGGQSLALGSLTLSARLDIDPAVALRAGCALSLRGGRVDVLPDFLAPLVPGLRDIPFDIDLAVDADRGVIMAGGTALSVRLPAPGGPGATVDALEVALRVPDVTGPGAPAAPSVPVEFTTSLVAAAGDAIRMGFARVGMRLPFLLGDGPVLGFDPAGLVPLPPAEAAVELNLPGVRGGGRLSSHAPGEFAGALAVSVPPLSAGAFAVLALPREGRPLSFVALIGADFKPFGIQIGFGLAVTGVGGVVGVNRRIERTALARAVSDGTAARLLLPADPGADAGRVLAALPAIFPEAPGQVIVGPMFEVGWGARGMVSVAAAVLTELPDPVRVTILGSLRVALPQPEIPLVLLRATFVGEVDPAVPSMSFRASLAGSHIVGVALSGEVFVLTRGGADADLIVSAGGFHPAYRPPAGVEPVARLGLDLSPGGLLSLRCQAYLAITSNSVQFGARIELSAGVAGFGVHGHLGFDVLVQWHPHLRFSAQVGAGLAVEVFGETLLGISFELAIDGPAPWRVRGTARIELFLFSIPLSFDTSWGDPPPAAVGPAPDLGQILKAEFERPSAWNAQPPDPGGLPVRLTDTACRGLAAGTLVHPYGSITARQRTLPLGIEIERFARAPVPRQRWDIVRGGFAADGAAGGQVRVHREPVRDEFAPGDFLDFPGDAERLSRPAFESYVSGVRLHPEGLTGLDRPRPHDLRWETRVIGAGPADGAPDRAGSLAAAENLAATGDVLDPRWWRPREERVVVYDEQPLTAAGAWSMTVLPGARPPPEATATVTELKQWIDAGPAGVALLMVENWEMAD